MASVCASPHAVLHTAIWSPPRHRFQRQINVKPLVLTTRGSHGSLVNASHLKDLSHGRERAIAPAPGAAQACRDLHRAWAQSVSLGGKRRLPAIGGLCGDGTDKDSGGLVRRKALRSSRSPGTEVSCLGRPGTELEREDGPSIAGSSDDTKIAVLALDAGEDSEGNLVGLGEEWGEGIDAQIAYAVLLATVPVVPLLPRFQLSASVYFLAMAALGVYLGSHRSLQGKLVQKISFKQSLAVPLLTSASLFGFYCLLRFFPELDLRTFVAGYLTLAGAAAVGSNLAGPFRAWFGNQQQTTRFLLPTWLAQEEGEPVHVDVALTDVLATAVGIGAALATWQQGAPFTVSNFVALCLVTDIMQLLSLGSFATAATMLGGLLLYDVFWVFGSPGVFGDNVMVTVATSQAFNGPMKLIFPRFGDPAAIDAMGANAFSILGLGDIAAPGLLIALMLRFDRSRSRQAAADNESARGNNGSPSSDTTTTTSTAGGIDKTYFSTGMVAYVLGLVTTVVANALSGEAQPALLYLVPFIVGGTLLTAALRSELGVLFAYRDEETLSERMKKNADLE